MKLSIILSATALSVWLFGGSFWYIHHHHPQDGVAFPNVSLYAPSDHWELHAPFVFIKGKSSLQLLQRTRNAIHDIQLYLQAHPKRQLVITGLGNPEEIGENRVKGLAIARAKSVLKHFDLSQLKPNQIVIQSEIESFPILFNDRYICGVHLRIDGQAIVNPVRYVVEDTTFDLLPASAEDPDKQAHLFESWVKNARLQLLQSEDRKIFIHSQGGPLEFAHDNLREARKKAMDLKQKLIELGLTKDRISLRVEQRPNTEFKLRLQVQE